MSTRKINGGMNLTATAIDGAGAPIQTGWSYVVRPPQWPIVNTPRQRGGVRAGLTASEAHFVLCTETNVERIFFLYAVDGAGAHVPCQCHVEAIPRSGSNPPELAIAAGWFVERHVGASGSAWSSLEAIQVSSLAPDDPVRVQLNQVIAAGPGGTSGGGVNN